MTDNVIYIDCKKHGSSLSSVVCRHLVNNFEHQIGFIENSSKEDDLQGWCYACEYMFEQENDMTEKFKNFNDMALVCGQCYADIKKHHTIERE